MNGRNAIIGVLVLFGLAGCEPASGPSDQETWVLRSVAGSSLPALVSDGSNLLVLSDTLTFGGNYPAIFPGPLVSSARRVGAPGGPPSRSNGIYQLEKIGNQVTLRLRCPPNADCLIDERHGTVDGNTMTLEYAQTGPGPSYRSPVVYQRVH